MSGNENRTDTENRVRYEGILRDHRPHASEQLKAAFLSQAEGYYLGAHDALTAFDWFWKGWAASSGARAQRAEVDATETVEFETACLVDGVWQNRFVKITKPVGASVAPVPLDGPGQP